VPAAQGRVARSFSFSPAGSPPNNALPCPKAGGSTSRRYASTDHPPWDERGQELGATDQRELLARLALQLGTLGSDIVLDEEGVGIDLHQRPRNDDAGLRAEDFREFMVGGTQGVIGWVECVPVSDKPFLFLHRPPKQEPVYRPEELGANPELLLRGIEGLKLAAGACHDAVYRNEQRHDKPQPVACSRLPFCS